MVLSQGVVFTEWVVVVFTVEVVGEDIAEPAINFKLRIVRKRPCGMVSVELSPRAKSSDLNAGGLV
jgi:hypothetical protein